MLIFHWGYWRRKWSDHPLISTVQITRLSFMCGLKRNSFSPRFRARLMHDWLCGEMHYCILLMWKLSLKVTPIYCSMFADISVTKETALFWLWSDMLSTYQGSVKSNTQKEIICKYVCCHHMQAVREHLLA